MTNKWIQSVAIVGTALLLSACSTTHQASSVQKSGFLTDYSQLTKGNSDQSLLRYVNPSAQWSKYTGVIVEPVSVYAGKDSDLAKTSPEERQALASYFTAALKEALKPNYALVTTPGPNVMVIRTAITDADSSMAVLNTITTIMPIGLAASTLQRAVTGSDSFVGDAQAEMEILDSDSGQRLAAVVDKRLGTKALRSKFGGWNDAKAAFDFWSERLSARLEQARDGKLNS